MDKRQKPSGESVGTVQSLRHVAVNISIPKIVYRTDRAGADQSARKHHRALLRNNPLRPLSERKVPKANEKWLGMLHLAGFKVRDVHMEDLISGTETLDTVKLIVFAGGSAHADVFGSAKGWARRFLVQSESQRCVGAFLCSGRYVEFGACVTDAN